jgi:gliding motility-associated-like protein
MKKILTLVFLLTAIVMGFAQAPPNDECATATVIPFPLPYQSTGLAFTNVNATASSPIVIAPPAPIGPVPNWIPAGAIQRDVWFTFTTPSGNGIGITLDLTTNTPNTFLKYALYKGNCTFLITETKTAAVPIDYASGVGSATGTFSEDILDLDPGTQYFLRIDNGILPVGVPGNAAGATFDIAISEYCAPINMANGSSNFCNNACIFYDSGGPLNNYGANENLTYTICPPNPTGCLVLDFSMYDIDCVVDGLSIFNGNSTSAADLITVIRGTGTNLVVEVPSGCATLRFQSNTALSGDGWAMTWSCTSAPCAPTAISDCNSATPVTTLPFTGNYSTCGAGNNYDSGDACGSGYMNSEDYTFAYTSPGGECIAISLTNTSVGTGIFIMDGCPNADATNCIKSVESTSGNPVLGSVELTNPGTYYIVVSGQGCPSCTDFDIIIEPSACPMSVNPNVTALDLAEKIAGKNVEITNIQLDCPPGAYGTFEGGPSGIPIQGGIILSTGFADDAEGPNVLDGSAAFPGQDANTPIGSPGDLQLTQSITPNVSTIDACILEFDVYAPTDLLTFNYVFMSEEYLEFVGSVYNDIFGFWIRGPGILDGNTDVLISAIPNTSTPITVSTVNNVTNSTYYINNPSGDISTAYDGFTTLLTATSVVTPCNTYHLRMAIADGIDQFFDSGVLIEEGSLFNQGVELEIAGATVGNALSCAENCLDGTITISLVAPQVDTVLVPIDIQGSAINGTDYQTIPNVLIFPPGVTSITIPILPFADGILEPTESIILYLYEECSDSIPSDSAIIFIRDDISDLFSTNDTTICGSPLPLPLYGPTDDIFYSWSPSAGLDDSTARNPTAYPDQNTTYTVIVGNGICWDTLTMDVIVATMNTPEDTIICTPGESVALYATTNQPNVTWTWTPTTNLSNASIVNPIATPTVTTTYSVLVSTPVCDINEEITITVFEGAANVTEDQTICEGQDSVEIGGLARLGLVYSWSPIEGLDDPNIANPTASPSITTTYTLTVTGGDCSNTNTVTVNVGGPFDLLAIEDISIFQGDAVDITAVPVPQGISPIGPITYTWTPVRGLTGTNSQVTASPFETTTYTVMAISDAGCEAGTGFTIQVDPPTYAFPNAFTPGGKNPYFAPIIEGNIVVNNFQIFNRWGQLVFDNGNALQGWNGTIGGQDAPQDTYIYVATLTLPTGEVVELKDNLLLVR